MKNICIIIVSLFIVFIVFNFHLGNDNLNEDFGNIDQPHCNWSKTSILKEAMDNVGVDKKDFYIPCSYNTCETDAKIFEDTSEGVKLFLIDGCDYIASKFALWEILRIQYKDEATKYMPKTFLLNKPNDVAQFTDHYNKNLEKRPDQMYVLKNYEQRQEGIKLTRDLNEILDGYKNGWYLAQDYIYNPYIISNRKINLRYYLLVVCNGDTIEGYLHQDGFVYYTKEDYDENDMSFDKHITTGYVDRKIYDENPLTLANFRQYLKYKDPDSVVLWNKNAKSLMNRTVLALSSKICQNKKISSYFRFQLFGCDLAPSANLDAMLMEINKGPDMGAKDKRDHAIKLKVQEDIFKLIRYKNKESNENGTRFIKIYSNQ